MDNVQNYDSYFNVPLSQTYRSYLIKILWLFKKSEFRHFVQIFRNLSLS
jgi:hypothetical protein